MPAEFNLERVVYRPQVDQIIPESLRRTVEVLKGWTKRDVKSVNDAIEVYQCKLIAEMYGEHLKADSAALITSGKQLFTIACNLISNLLQSKNLSVIFDSVEMQYIEQFWQFLAVANLWSTVSDESFGSLLDAFPNQIPHLLEHRRVVNQYDLLLTEAMKASVCISAEAIISAFAVDGNDNKHFYLPRSLSKTDIDQIMLFYLEETPPKVRLNYVEILVRWPSSVNNKYSPSPEVRVTAQRRVKSLKEEAFPNPNSGIRFGSEVRFSLEQKVCKKVVYEDGILIHTFGLKWLQEYTDPATILNNFLYVFDLVGKDGVLNCASHRRTGLTLLKVIGLHSHDEYQMTLEAKIENMAALGKVFGYRRLLLESKTRLEDAIGWFFNNYIEDEFEIEGFSISLPTEETSLLDKCKAIGPEIERVLKAFMLYVENGSIDTGYFPYMDIKDFREIPSLLDRKYLVEGEKFGLPANLLLSDQSLLACSSAYPNNDGEFYRLVSRLHLTKNDFHKVCLSQLEYLIDKKFLKTEYNGILRPTLQAQLIALIWKRGTAKFSDFTCYSEQIKELVSEKVITYSSALFSPDEADYLSYLLNNAKFSDAVALRNKYGHGSGSISDFTEKEMESDYCFMLAALIGIAIKINEELSYKTGRGGLDARDLVDWPLVEE